MDLRTLDYPRMLHRGDERLTVDSADKAELALAAGYTLRKGEKPAPPKAAPTPEPVKPAAVAPKASKKR